MRNFNLLDTNSFRPFYIAAETLNFTLAAKKVGLTQSGVSQHIQRLESQLGVPLFLRVNRRVALTEAGKKLKSYVEKFVDEVELLREDIGHEMTLLKGFVSYAMPASCLMSPHFSLLLAERNKKYPGVDLKVNLCPSGEVMQKLLGLEIDFGFVTANTRHPAITFAPFCPEEYILIGRSRKEVEKVSARSLHELRFISHPGVDTLFDHWVSHHFPTSKNVTWDSLNVVGEMNSLHGVIEMIRAGLGFTIIPRHCVASLLAEKKIASFDEHSDQPLLSQIYIVTLTDQRPPRRVQAVIDTFFAMKS